VPHRAAMATLDDLRQRFALGMWDRTLAVSALDFDLSVFDIFGALDTGAAVVMVDEQERQDAHRWAELIRLHRVTVLNCVPPLLDALLRAVGTGPDLASLRVALVGGDRVGVDLPGRLAAVARGCRFIGLGGTTETSIHSTVCEVDPDAVPADWRLVPYGGPLRGVALRVVDHLGRDRPDWVAGELWIGGDGVARGYRGDPERTEERFVERDGRRWYRTGDLARYRPDGSVEFLGRRDDQVKIRGFRVELGEVEAALRADPRVRAAIAVLTSGAAPGLAAAVATTGAVDPDSLRASAADLVPPHMVPDRVVVLDALPLTANGKLDRDAARELVERAGRPVTGQQPPRDELEQAIALVWADSLRLAEPGELGVAEPGELGVAEPGELGVTDDFFAVGGDSLRATTVVSSLREALDTSAVSVRMLFAAPTVAGLAERLRAADPTGRLDKVAALYCEVAAMSDDEVAAALDAAALDPDGWPR